VVAVSLSLYVCVSEMRRASTTCISSDSSKLAFPVSSLHLSFLLDISDTEGAVLLLRD